MAERLETAGVWTAAALVRSLPLPVALRAGRALGGAAFRLGVRRDVALENLERALGTSRTAPERRAIARAAYEHLGENLVEFLAMSQRGTADVLARTELQGLDNLRTALAGGRGAIVASGHLGNWEILGGALSAAGFPVTFVVQPLRNARIDAVVQSIRRGAGIEVLARGMALRRIRESLARNRLVFFMCDQDARRRGIFVPFFGVPASTPTGAAQLALRFDVPFMTSFGWRTAPWRHLARFEAALETGVGDEESKVRGLLAEFTQRLEDAVRAHPEQYWWAHRRWKTRPNTPAPEAPRLPGAPGV